MVHVGNGMAWCMVSNGIVRYDVVFHLVWYGMMWYSMVWYGMKDGRVYGKYHNP